MTMARGYFPERGSEYAPCEPSCHHTDCAATRRMMAGTCRICGKGFDFGQPYYTEEGIAVHALCLEEEVETKLKLR